MEDMGIVDHRHPLVVNKSPLYLNKNSSFAIVS